MNTEIVESESALRKKKQAEARAKADQKEAEEARAASEEAGNDLDPEAPPGDNPERRTEPGDEATPEEPEKKEEIEEETAEALAEENGESEAPAEDAGEVTAPAEETEEEPEDTEPKAAEGKGGNKTKPNTGKEKTKKTKGSKKSAKRNAYDGKDRIEGQIELDFQSLTEEAEAEAEPEPAATAENEKPDVEPVKGDEGSREEEEPEPKPSNKRVFKRPKYKKKQPKPFRQESGGKTESTESAEKSRPQETVRDTREFLGYVRVNDAGPRKFYNYYPIAVLRTDYSVRALGEGEAAMEFPQHGNINIYDPNASWGDSRLAEAFVPLELYVLNIAGKLVETNYRGKTIEVNETETRLELGKLQTYDCYHTLEEKRIYPVVNSLDTMNALLENRRLLLRNFSRQEWKDGDRVLLRDEGFLYGPFEIYWDEDNACWYIDPHTERRDYVVTAWAVNDLAFCEVQVPRNMGFYVTMSARLLVSLNLLEEHSLDVISDDALISMYRSGKPKSTVSGEIEKSRRERFTDLLRQRQFLGESDEEIFDQVAVLIENAAQNDTEQGQERLRNFLGKLLQTPQIQKRIQEVPAVAARLSGQTEELGRLAQREKELEEANRRLEGLLAMEKQKVERLTPFESEALNLREKLEDNRERLEKFSKLEEIQEAVAREEEKLSGARLEHERVEMQTREILGQLSQEVKVAAGRFAEVALNERVAAILHETAGGVATRPDGQTVRLTGEEYERSFDLMAGLEEQKLLETLVGRVRKYRDYSNHDIVNLFVNITQNFLTVFSGLPGTGKTSTCMILAHALGLDRDNMDLESIRNRFAMVSVERGWSSKRDLVGYWNPLTRTFDHNGGETHRALQITDREQTMQLTRRLPPYIVLLDEANLSQMEYYWADFMIACDRMDGRSTIALSDDLRYAIAPSLRFLATMNIDQTTETLSPRLMDRASIISLPRPKRVATQDMEFEEVYSAVSLEELDRLFGPIDRKLSDDGEARLMEVLTHCRTRLRMPVSARTEIAMRRYISAAARRFLGSLSTQERETLAMDYAVLQRVLPKIQGSGEGYRRELGALVSILLGSRFERSAEMLKSIVLLGDANMQYYSYFM